MVAGGMLVCSVPWRNSLEALFVGLCAGVERCDCYRVKVQTVRV